VLACRAAKRGRRLRVEVPSEALLGCFDVVEGGLVVAGGHEALDQQHVAALVERGQLHTTLCQPDRGVGVTGAEGADALFTKKVVDPCGDLLSCHEQPHGELWPTVRVDALEELSGCGRVDDAVGQGQDVDGDPRR
jgi:hypothetical protein